MATSVPSRPVLSRERSVRYLERFVAMVAFTAASAGLLEQLLHPSRFLLPWGMPANVPLVAGLALWFWGAKYGIPIDHPVARFLSNALAFIPANLWLWVFGNITHHKMLEDVHRTTMALQKSALFARLSGLSPADTKQYFVVYTHKGDHDPVVGHGDHYRVPGFPFDEVEIVMLVWHYVASNLDLGWPNTRTMCSCSHDNAPLWKKVVAGSFTIVGSPKGNEYCRLLMERIRELERTQTQEGPLLTRLNPYKMVVEGGLCLLTDSVHDDLKPDATNPAAPDVTTTLTDYALLMKLPNLFAGPIDKRHTIMVLAGCKCAGQVALTDWMSQPLNLAQLARDHAADYFQMVFRVQYRFVPQGIPDICDVQLIHEETIAVR